MLKARGRRFDGAPVYIFGLAPENLRRLSNDEPILVNLRELGHPEDVHVALVAGEDVQRIMAIASRGGEEGTSL